MKLSIIIPVFNEESTIGTVVKAVSKIDIPNVKKEILIVDDGSTDKTPNEIQRIKKFVKNVSVISHASNKGKGSAVRTGIEKSTGDYILIQDADLEYHPSDIPKLVQVISNKQAEVVYGTRLKRLPNFLRDERTIRFFIHYSGNKFLSLLTSLLYGQWITDMETGYKLFPRQAVRDIKLSSRSFDFEPEITAKMLKKGYNIIEVPISTNPRGYDEGKKLNTIKDGAIALWALVKYRFVD